MDKSNHTTIVDPFDYSVIDTLSMAEKIQLLGFIAFRGEKIPDKGFTDTQLEILEHLTIQRLINPGFMPIQLIPENW